MKFKRHHYRSVSSLDQDSETSIVTGIYEWAQLVSQMNCLMPSRKPPKGIYAASVNERSALTVDISSLEQSI